MLLAASSHIWSFSETEPKNLFEEEKTVQGWAMVAKRDLIRSFSGIEPKNLLDEEKKAQGWAMVANRDLIVSTRKQRGEPETEQGTEQDVIQIFVSSTYGYIRTYVRF